MLLQIKGHWGKCNVTPKREQRSILTFSLQWSLCYAFSFVLIMVREWRTGKWTTAVNTLISTSCLFSTSRSVYKDYRLTLYTPVHKWDSHSPIQHCEGSYCSLTHTPRKSGTHSVYRTEHIQLAYIAAPNLSSHKVIVFSQRKLLCAHEEQLNWLPKLSTHLHEMRCRVQNCLQRTDSKWQSLEKSERERERQCAISVPKGDGHQFPQGQPWSKEG